MSGLLYGGCLQVSERDLRRRSPEIADGLYLPSPQSAPTLSPPALCTSTSITSHWEDKQRVSSLLILGIAMSVLLNIVVLFGGVVLLRIPYLLFLHPLASYPGPFLAKLTNFWSAPRPCLYRVQPNAKRRRCFSFLKGAQHLTDLELHRRYGNFVRDGPNSLLVADVEAFKAIYGFAKTREKGDFYTVMSNGKPHDPNVFAARTDALHREAKRKLVSAAVTSLSSEIKLKPNISSLRPNTSRSMSLP